MNNERVVASGQSGSQQGGISVPADLPGVQTVRRLRGGSCILLLTSGACIRGTSEELLNTVALLTGARRRYAAVGGTLFRDLDKERPPNTPIRKAIHILAKGSRPNSSSPKNYLNAFASAVVKSAGEVDLGETLWDVATRAETWPPRARKVAVGAAPAELCRRVLAACKSPSPSPAAASPPRPGFLSEAERGAAPPPTLPMPPGRPGAESIPPPTMPLLTSLGAGVFPPNFVVPIPQLPYPLQPTLPAVNYGQHLRVAFNTPGAEYSVHPSGNAVFDDLPRATESHLFA